MSHTLASPYQRAGSTTARRRSRYRPLLLSVLNCEPIHGDGDAQLCSRRGTSIALICVTGIAVFSSSSPYNFKCIRIRPVRYCGTLCLTQPRT